MYLSPPTRSQLSLAPLRLCSTSLPTNSTMLSPTPPRSCATSRTYQVSLGVTPSFACAEIDVDIRRTLRATLRNTLTLHRSLCYNGKSFLGAGDGVKEVYATKTTVDGGSCIAFRLDLSHSLLKRKRNTGWNQARLQG